MMRCLFMSFVLMFIPGTTSLLFAQEKLPDEDLERDMKRLPAVELDKVFDSFEVQKGFSLEIVAAEPIVADPVDACFDAEGQMYVAEMRGYPYSQYPVSYDKEAPGKPDFGVVRFLWDTDGDGNMDKSSIFAQDISWPTSVCCYDGGVFVMAPPNLYYFKDTDGDHKADRKEIVATGFDRNNVQGLANNLKWGLDGKIYGASGSNGGTLKVGDKELFSLRGRDFRFDPKTREFEPVTGGRQFGHSMDDWGNRFMCTNSNHIMQAVFPVEYLQRNPYLAAPGMIRTIGKEGAAAPVFRISPAEPWRIVRTKRRASDPKFAKRLPPNELVPVGFFTSATGVTIYRGTAYPKEFQGNAFIGDVGGNLLHRKTLKPNGAAMLAERADQNTEFIRSTDTWFRPVNFVNAPDGTLYVLDMYRETIEHPYSIPKDIKSFLDLESGYNRGRVYRMVSPGMTRIKAPLLTEASTEQLVQQLNSGNSWNRETAQRLLWERQDQTAVELLEQLFEHKETTELGRLHALWTLRGLDALSSELIVSALLDESAGVRVHALKLADAVINENKEVAEAALKLVEDDDFQVQWQLAFTLGELESDESVEALTALARKHAKNSDMRVAILSSVNPIAEAMAISLTQEYIGEKQSALSGIVVELARIVGARNQPEEVNHLLEVVLEYDSNLSAQRLLLQSLGEGLSRSGAGLTAYLKSNKLKDGLKSQLKKRFDSASDLALDEENSESVRKAAIQLLAYADFELSSGSLVELLEPRVPQSLQISAVNALSEQSAKSVGQILIENWKAYSPNVRNAVIEKLMVRADRVQTLLDAVEAEEIKSSEIAQDRKQLLQNHPQDSIRKRARELFGKDIDPNREKIIQQYAAVLGQNSNAKRGYEVFKKNCSTCHKVGTEGYQVGPDLASVKNKSEEDLLIAILDPNREAQSNFTSYTIVTEDGKLYNGLIAAESGTSITLREAEGKETTVLRSNIEELNSSGLSLMPQGLEKNITPQQMADVIIYLKQIGEKK